MVLLVAELVLRTEQIVVALRGILPPIGAGKPVVEIEEFDPTTVSFFNILSPPVFSFQPGAFHFIAMVLTFEKKIHTANGI